MKNHQFSSLFAPAAAALIAFAPTAQASSLATPTAIVQVSFTGGGKRDFLSTPFVRAVEKTGTVAAVASATSVTLTDSTGATYSNAAFTPGSNTSDTKYILEILDGPMIGLVAYIKSNVGNTFTVDESELPTDGSLVGARFAIRKDWTLESLFGPASATSPFTAGASASGADNINIFNPKTQGFSTYYIRVSGSTYTWRDAVNNVANHVRVPYGQGVQVLRRAAGNGTATLYGEVRTARLRRDIPNGKYGLIANLSPAATTLGDLNININRNDGFGGDVVMVWNAAGGSWTQYRRRTNDGGWRDSANLQDRYSVTINPGDVVRVVNKSGVDRKGLTAITADPRLP